MLARSLLYFLLLFPLVTLSAKDYFQNPDLLANTLQQCASNPSSISQADCLRAKQARAELADLLLVLKTSSQNFGKQLLALQMKSAKARQQLQNAKTDAEKKQWAEKIKQYEVREQRYYVILRMITWTQ